MTARHGDNLYPSTLAVSFGELKLNLDVPAGVWNPTAHGLQLGEVLVTMDFADERVLELGTGCGLHAIAIAHQGASSLCLTEVESAVLDNARHNLKKHGVTADVTYEVADWTQVKHRDFDTLVTNPPFARSGKRYRRYFIDTLILDAHKLIRPGGRLIFVQSSMADVPRSLALMAEHGMHVRLAGEVERPFRDYYFEDKVYLREMASIPGSYTVRGDTHFERLVVFEATLPR